LISITEDKDSIKLTLNFSTILLPDYTKQHNAHQAPEIGSGVLFAVIA